MAAWLWVIFHGTATRSCRGPGYG
ncbi:hypothetical protein CCACVL1_24073 [Corchorus capsularis]|uniref:Uncharacterized protein n=1 Tax=Corchorus capsularis TaxID=210143 RepID=A0A1R3GR53_COCAP|nr:hypothetical protein CCACVL1_24073 [Corchorus capsularis]